MTAVANVLHDPAIIHPTPHPGLLLADYFDREYGYRCWRPGGSKAWLLFYTVGGQGTVRAGNRDVLCEPYSVTCITPDTPHHYFTSAGARWQFFWVYFLPKPAWGDLMLFPEAAKGIMQFSLPEHPERGRVEAVCKRIVQDARFPGDVRRELAMNGLEELFWLFRLHGGGDAARAAGAADDRVKRVVELLAGGFGEKHTLASLARRVCLSPSRLSHLFRERTGESVMEALMRIRLQEAAKLLQYTSLSVGETAERTGFVSTAYFSRTFSRYFGKSPAAFRKKTTRL